MYLVMRTISVKLIVAAAYLSCLTIHAEETKTSHAPLPVVSIRELDTLSATNIRQHYPDGIAVFRLNLLPGLKAKLDQLEKEGYTITYLGTDSKALQALTSEVISKSNITRYLLMAYDSNPGCSMFFSQEFIPHIMRREGQSAIADIEDLAKLTPEQLSGIKDNHHLWKDLGYETGTGLSQEVENWVANSAKAASAINRSALSDCKVHLDKKQQTIVNQLISLDYLSNAVQGLFYSGQGINVTHYRQLAVETLPK